MVLSDLEGDAEDAELYTLDCREFKSSFKKFG